MNDIDENIKQELAADGSISGIEEENREPYPFNAEKISISNKKISLSNVIRRLDRGSMYAADLQRCTDLWDIVMKSRLIESLMLKIPLPLFYAAQNKNDQLFIVDGLQRISAIKGFVHENNFKLKSLEFLKELEGKSYNDIPERMQTRIYETELDFVIIEPDSPPEIQRNIFKRLNTGGLPLNEQEIRHALYFGPITKFLKELVDTQEFQSAVDRRINDSRMSAQELILRFLSFLIMDTNEYKKDGEMDLFLSDAMQIFNKLIEPNFYSKNIMMLSIERNYRNITIDEIKINFLTAMTRARELFDNCAFRKTTPAKYKISRIRAPINKSLFETWSIFLSEMSKDDFNKLISNKELLYQNIDDVFNKNAIIEDWFSKGSLKVHAVKKRHEAIREMVKCVLSKKIFDPSILLKEYLT